MRPDETELWRTPESDDAEVCVMISCCSGAELQVRCGDEIVLRELYPDKSALYERAAELRPRNARNPRNSRNQRNGRDADQTDAS